MKGYTPEELKEAREQAFRDLDIEVMESGDYTMRGMLAHFNGRPIWGRILITPEHANWMNEILGDDDDDD